MYFANPWGLLGLLALPAILAIHFFHRRFPPLVIAGAHLWGIETEVQTTGRRWDRLPLTASLFFELLAALLLSLLLSQPRLGELGTARHLVVVLDQSASMQAAPPNGVSFREQAIEQLRERAEALPAGSRVTVILTGPEPQTLAGPAVPWAVAESRLDQWRPSLPAHRFQPAWDRAAQFADQSGEILFLTDQLPPESDPVPAPMEVVAVGEALRNVALTTAEWTLDRSTLKRQLYLRVANYSGANATIEVRGRSGSEEVFSHPLSVPPGGEEPWQVDVPEGVGQLTVELISPADGLALDNVITLIEPQPRPVNVSVTLPEGDAAREDVMRGLDSLAGIKLVTPDQADLQIATASPLPESDRDLWWFGIGPIDRSIAARAVAVDLRGPYVLERRHPLVRDVLLGTLIWGGVQPVPFPVMPLISCDQTPLLAKLEGTLTTGFLLNVDFARVPPPESSSQEEQRNKHLAQSEDWPILLYNLIELRRADLPGLSRWNYRLGETIRFREPATEPTAEATTKQSASSPEELALVQNGERRPLVRDSGGLVEISFLNQAGTYEVADESRVLDRFAVNFFDPAESNLSKLDAGVREPTETDGELFRLDNPYSWLILFGLAVVLGLVIADWKSLARL